MQQLPAYSIGLKNASRYLHQQQGQRDGLRVKNLSYAALMNADLTDSAEMKSFQQES